MNLVRRKAGLTAKLLAFAASGILFACTSDSDSPTTQPPVTVSETAPDIVIGQPAAQDVEPTAPLPDRVIPTAIDLSNLTISEGKLISRNSEFHVLGDVNGDGKDDLLLRQFSPENYYEFAVVFGSDDPSTLPVYPTADDLNTFNGFLIESADNVRTLGQSGALAGDINGDGLNDIVIGSPSLTANQSQRVGKLYVVYGSEAPFSKRFFLNELNGRNGFTISGFHPG